MLAELRALIEGALRVADEHSTWELERELHAVELVGDELDQVTADPEQQIHLTALERWVRSARKCYKPAPYASEESLFKHYSTSSIEKSSDQEILKNGSVVYPFPPSWGEAQRAQARAILVNHITYADDDALRAMLAWIGSPEL